MMSKVDFSRMRIYKFNAMRSFHLALDVRFNFPSG